MIFRLDLISLLKLFVNIKISDTHLHLSFLVFVCTAEPKLKLGLTFKHHHHHHKPPNTSISQSLEGQLRPC